MLNRLISSSLKHRWLVLIAVTGLCVLGLYNYQQLPIDAVPDKPLERLSGDMDPKAIK